MKERVAMGSDESITITLTIGTRFLDQVRFVTNSVRMPIAVFG